MYFDDGVTSSIPRPFKRDEADDIQRRPDHGQSDNSVTHTRPAENPLEDTDGLFCPPPPTSLEMMKQPPSATSPRSSLLLSLSAEADSTDDVIAFEGHGSDVSSDGIGRCLHRALLGRSEGECHGLRDRIPCTYTYDY